VAILEPLSPSDLSVAESADNPKVEFDLDAAGLAAQVSAHANSDKVTAIGHLVQLIWTWLPRPLAGHQKVPERLASTDASLRPVAHWHVLDVRVEEPAPGFFVAAFEGGEHLTQPLDVLLRHRLRSIARRSTAFHAKRIAATETSGTTGMQSG
jgi:hypothetical protein